MSKQLHTIQTENAPAAIGPYAQGVRFGNMIYTSGQIPIDPATGSFVEGGVEAQAVQALKNLEAVLVAAGSGLDHVVKTTVFLQNLGDFKVVNGLYAEAFGDTRPARSTVEVAALPMGALVEIEAVAIVKG